jgi:hypothetical protein
MHQQRNAVSNTIDILKNEYRTLALAHGRATNTGDYKEANSSHDKLVMLLSKIRACGRDGEAVLLALTEESDDAVVCWSATHVLPFDEKRALAVLNELAKKPGPVGFNAKMVVQQWKKGR